ncbi:MAG: CYTH domain-containing protein [Patescibacteria group bacterium]
MSTTYEIEIKTLLGEESVASKFREDLRALDPTLTMHSSYAQLNHYFEGGDLNTLCDGLAPLLSQETLEKLKLVAEKGIKVSVRTREMNGVAKFVLKASVGDDSSENGVARLEIEEDVPVSLPELDSAILSAGYTYQAKWSRVREEYRLADAVVCLDKNAGYGYLAEFEKVVDDAEKAEETKQELYTLMEKLGVSELSQDRLERMFAHYNEHWPDYYGTEKVFVIE